MAREKAINTARFNGQNGPQQQIGTIPMHSIYRHSSGEENDNIMKGPVLERYNSGNRLAVDQPIGHVPVHRIGDQYMFKLPEGFECMRILVREDPGVESRPRLRLPKLAESGLAKGHTHTRPKQRALQQPKRSHSDSHSDDEESYDGEGEIQTVSSECFHIGDESAMRSFCERRLGELTLKPLRKIVAEWLKIVAPNRRRKYGKYHKKFPIDMPPTATPPWWPKDVIYTEPAHLVGNDLIKVAIVIMFLHQETDPETQCLRANWTAKLRDEAVHSLKTTPVEDFTSGKLHNDYNHQMKARALDHLIPDLFETAQAYEDHVAMYDLFDGRTNDNPESKRGKQHTWSTMKRPLRSQISKAKPEHERSVKRVCMEKDRSRSVEHNTTVGADEPVKMDPESCSSSVESLSSDKKNVNVAGVAGVAMQDPIQSSTSLPPRHNEQEIYPPYGTPMSFSSLSPAGSSVFTPDTPYTNAPTPILTAHGLPLVHQGHLHQTPADHNMYGNFDVQSYPIYNPQYTGMVHMRNNPDSNLPPQSCYPLLPTPDVIKMEGVGHPRYPAALPHTGNPPFAADNFDVKVDQQHLNGVINSPLMNPNVSFESTMAFDTTRSMGDLIGFRCE